jgi:hypothetical protein
MAKLEIGQALLTCHGGRIVRIEYSIPRGEFQKDFPSIFEAKAWCQANSLRII